MTYLLLVLNADDSIREVKITNRPIVDGPILADEHAGLERRVIGFKAEDFTEWPA